MRENKFFKKLIIYKVLIFLLCLNTYGIHATYAQNKLSGKITDEKAGFPLAGASVSIPDLKVGTVADTSGYFELTDLPKGTFLVEVKYIGYSTVLKQIAIVKSVVSNFALSTSIIEKDEIVITGTSKATELKRSPIPIAAITAKQMDMEVNTNVIDAIAKLPGVSAVTTGPNVSKPFIRGLGYNRILTLYDGVRQEGQQWGDEHGIEVDEYSVERAEVIKGPASLTYGSDALAGVVNLIPYQSVPSGTIKGSVTADYQSNNGLFGGSAALAGNDNGLIWGFRGSYKAATNYQDPIDGRVYGTAFNEKDGSGYIGLNKKWGYAHLNLSAFDDLQEIPDGSRDPVTHQFTKQITEADTIRPVVSNAELNSYTITPLHQHVQHYRAYLSNKFIFGQSTLVVNLAVQDNIRREFSHPQAPDVAGLYLDLHTYSYDVKYSLPEWRGWDATVGINGMYQTNSNKGTEFIIPDYNEFDVGPFAFVKKTFNKLDFSAGVRYDTRFFKNFGLYTAPNAQTGFDEAVAATDSGATHTFSNYSHTFSGASGSIGATYNFSSHFLIKANVARGFRAPNIAEISANGVHPGTDIYQIGNPGFQPELSLQEDIGVFYDSKHISGSVEVFNNNITNYIFDEKVLNSKGQDSIIVPGNQTFKFQQGAAQLYGGEVSLDIHPHPLDWLHFENSVSIVYGLNKGVKGQPVNDSSKYLPLIPPLHTNSELRAVVKKKFKYFSGVYVKIGVEYYAAQNRAFLAYNTETVTPSYTLFNAGFGGDITNKSGKILFSLNFAGSNITNVAYQSNMSRLKYFTAPGNPLGIYNMGRNITVKLTVPFGLKG